MTDLTTGQKESILAMTKPSDLNPDERKRQYSSLRRAIYRDAPPALVAKFQMCSDAERFFDLKPWEFFLWSAGLLIYFPCHMFPHLISIPLDIPPCVP